MEVSSPLAAETIRFVKESPCFERAGSGSSSSSSTMPVTACRRSRSRSTVVDPISKPLANSFVGPSSPRDSEQIAETNLALVLAMAKRVRIVDSEFADLVSEGNMASCDRSTSSLWQGVQVLDLRLPGDPQGLQPTRHEHQASTAFPTDSTFEKSDFLGRRQEQVTDSAEEVRHIMDNNHAALSSVERTVILHRFGVGARPMPPRSPSSRSDRSSASPRSG